MNKNKNALNVNKIKHDLFYCKPKLKLTPIDS